MSPTKPASSLTDLSALLTDPSKTITTVMMTDAGPTTDQELADALDVVKVAAAKPLSTIKEIRTSIKGPASLNALCELLVEPGNSIVDCIADFDEANPVTTEAALALADALTQFWSSIHTLILYIPCCAEALLKFSTCGLVTLVVFNPTFTFDQLVEMLRHPGWTLKRLYMYPIATPANHDDLVAEAIANGSRKLLQFRVKKENWEATRKATAANIAYQRLPKAEQ